MQKLIHLDNGYTTSVRFGLFLELIMTANIIEILQHTLHASSQLTLTTNY